MTYVEDNKENMDMENLDNSNKEQGDSCVKVFKADQKILTKSNVLEEIDEKDKV